MDETWKQNLIITKWRPKKLNMNQTQKNINEKYRHTKPKLGKLNIRKPGTLGNT